MRTRNVATYNCRVLRRGKTVRAFIERFSTDHAIDVWLLQEAHGYRKHLAKVVGFQHFQAAGWPDAGTTAILVRDGLDAGDPQTMRMLLTWPRPHGPGQHPARTLMTVDVVGTRFVSVHMPSIKGPKRGKAQRIAAYAECSARIVQLVAQVRDAGGSIVLAGDWNEGWREPGPHKPRWIAGQTGLKPVTAGGIDFGLTLGASGSEPHSDRKNNGGSDHPVVWFKVAVPSVEPPDPEPEPEPTMLLSDLADAARSSGLPVVEVDGWRTRSRPASTGGFAPSGVLCHHTGAASDGLDYATWLAKVGRSDLPAPLCQLALGRDGTVYVCAAGRSNHAGKARESGPMPAGDGNALYVGIEAMNSGSEGWPATQRDAYAALCAALCRWYGWPASHVRGHKETTTTGKWDPGLLGMDEFRADVARLIKEDDVALSAEDKQWIKDAIEAGPTLDVGKPNPWSDDTVAKVLLASLARIEKKLETAPEEKK